MVALFGQCDNQPMGRFSRVESNNYLPTYRDVSWYLVGISHGWLKIVCSKSQYRAFLSFIARLQQRKKNIEGTEKTYKKR